MNELLVRQENGGIGYIPDPKEGTYLAGGKFPRWTNFDATAIPYTSRDSGVLANVSMALDHILFQLVGVSNRLSHTEDSVQRLRSQNGDVLAEVRSKVAELNTYITESLTKSARLTHIAASVAMSSNPALTMDNREQAIKLNLSASGSFDDSRSMVGVTSIQLALETIAARQRELVQDVRALRETVDQLHAVVDRIEGE